MRCSDRRHPQTGSTYLLHTAYRQGKMRIAFVTNHDSIAAGYVVNAAGLYADKIASGVTDSLRNIESSRSKVSISIRTSLPVPFGPIYLLSGPGSEKPVPRRSLHDYGGRESQDRSYGHSGILRRENYEGFSNFRMNELIELLGRGLGLLTGAQFDYSVERSRGGRDFEIFPQQDGHTGSRCSPKGWWRKELSRQQNWAAVQESEPNCSISPRGNS